MLSEFLVIWSTISSSYLGISRLYCKTLTVDFDVHYSDPTFNSLTRVYLRSVYHCELYCCSWCVCWSSESLECFLFLVPVCTLCVRLVLLCFWRFFWYLLKDSLQCQQLWSSLLPLYSAITRFTCSYNWNLLLILTLRWVAAKFILFFVN